ncbi:MAG: hypothetical protein ACI4B3_11250 [Prevotella sp.]
MPYRRLPKTDAARLKALRTVLENNDIYTVRNRVVNWAVLNKCRPAYDRLLTALGQYKVRLEAQKRVSARIDSLQHNATMFVNHFVQVLLLAFERGEIKREYRKLYGLDDDSQCLPQTKTSESLIAVGEKIVEGEKLRLKKGGLPIYNPTIGKVATHLDIFKEVYVDYQRKKQMTEKALADIQALRPETDEIILDLWNQIEAHYAEQPPETRFNSCRKLGVIYYYRRHEPHIY